MLWPVGLCRSRAAIRLYQMNVATLLMFGTTLAIKKATKKASIEKATNNATKKVTNKATKKAREVTIGSL